MNSRWVQITNPDPDCHFCQLLFWASPESFRCRRLPPSKIRLDNFQIFCVRLIKVSKLHELSLRTLQTAIIQRLVVVEMRGFWQQWEGAILRSKEPTEFLNCLIPRRHETQAIKSPSAFDVDLTSVRRWYDFCISKHSVDVDSCAVHSPFHVPHMRVIDCNTRKVIKYTDQLYLALSYVWGGDAPISYDFNKKDDYLPNILPLTIEDALVATSRLGFRRICIDRY